MATPLALTYRSKSDAHRPPTINSARLQLLAGSVSTSCGYADSAVVPFGVLYRGRGLHCALQRLSQSWRLSDREVIFLRASEAQRRRLSDYVRMEAKRLSIEGGNAQLRELRSEAFDVMMCLDAVGVDPIVFPIGENAPRLPTVTVDQQSGKRIGLHIDTWEGLTEDERKSARARTCLNLGPGYRWFLFSDLAMSQMRVGGSDDVICDAKHLYETFLLRRTYLLRLAPGEGYIARTDTLVHDASTLWESKPSYFLHVLSYLQ